MTALQNKVRPTENQIDDSGRVASSSGEISANATTSTAVPVAFLPAAFKDETVMLTTRSEAQTAPPPDRWPDPAHVQLKDETVMLATRSEAQTASPPVRRLDPAHVQLLVNRGEQFMAAGDVAAARVMFRRAAEAVDAGAALAMGATYDPLMLKKIGALGVAADPDEARSWYEKAQEFGSPEALRRLDLLANR